MRRARKSCARCSTNAVRAALEGAAPEPIREGALTDAQRCRLKLSRMLRAGERPEYAL
jgi:hypothetical protein